jgi:O-succinylbenzoic acid--CoA ligase
MIQSITYLKGVTEEKHQLEVFLDQWFSPGKTVTIRTSGSTGTPKLIELNKEHMRISALATLDYFSIQKGGNALLCLSLTTIGGVMMVVRSIERSLNLIVAPVQSQPITDLNNHIEIDLAAMVPTQVHQLVEENPKALSSIRTLLVGGAPVTTQLIEKLNSINYTAYQTFGMTETISHVAVRKIGKETDDYYEALPHIQFSENDHQLVIHYPSISTNPIQTKEHIDDNFNKLSQHIKDTDRHELINIIENTLITLLKNNISNYELISYIELDNYSQEDFLNAYDIVCYAALYNKTS